MTDRELLRYLSDDCWVRAWGSTRYADDISVVAWWELLQGWLVRRVEHNLLSSGAGGCPCVDEGVYYGGPQAMTVVVTNEIDEVGLRLAAMETAAWLVLNFGVYLWSAPSMEKLSASPGGPAVLWGHLQDRLGTGYRLPR